MPASAGEMRPSAVTAVASWNTSPAPPRANEPTCTRCQSPGRPSCEEYWHIGDTHARLRNVVPRSVRGEKSRLMPGCNRDPTRDASRDRSHTDHRDAPAAMVGSAAATLVIWMHHHGGPIGRHSRGRAAREVVLVKSSLRAGPRRAPRGTTVRGHRHPLFGAPSAMPAQPARSSSQPRRRPASPAARRPSFDAPRRPSAGRPPRPARGSGSGKHDSGRGIREATSQLEAWFAAAAAEAVVTETSFAKLGLPQRLVTALERRDIRTALPIQAATLAAGLEGRDLIGRAQTGSGKTLGFGLPMLARLTAGHRRAGAPRGLVLVPTRELAVQVRDALEPLGHAVDLKTVAVFGGAPLGRQIQALGRGVDLVVATPGRLLDLIERGACRLDEIEITVLDEADHMADMGFLPDVRRLLDATPAGTQRMLFSATLDGAVGQVVRDYLSDPVARAVDPVESHIETMEHRALVVRTEAKVDVVAEIVRRPGRTLLFVRTKHGADRLAKQLGRLGVEALAIHGNRTQSARQKALDTFARGQVRVLVATDVAARGIHVSDVDLVVHVDPPNDHKDYLHRSGRTARAGASGVVVSLLGRDQVRTARRLFEQAGVQVTPVDAAPGTAEVRALAESGEPIVVAPAPVREGDGDRTSTRGRRPSSQQSNG